MTDYTYKTHKAHLEDKYDMIDSLKRDLLYSIAYEEGHSYGFHEVEYWYEKLLELVK